MNRFIRAEFGWKRWKQMVGLRADESRRVVKILDPARQKKSAEPGWVFCPLYDAGIQEIDVLKFWRAQAFDLGLAGRWEGNCDGCFLKNRGAISRMFADHPERMAWWAKMEAEKHGVGTGGTFRADREPYAEIARRTQDQGVLDFDLDDGIPCDEAGCGV